MENTDFEFLAVMLVVAIILVWAMILNWIDSIKISKAKKKKEQEESERMLKEADERTELKKWMNDNVNPKDENITNSATFTHKEIWYKEVKEDYPVLTDKYLDEEDYQGDEGYGNHAMMVLLLETISFVDLKDDKGEEYFGKMESVVNFSVNGEDREDGLEDWTISVGQPKEETAPKKRSRRISQKVKDLVWNRDGGKCVECGSNENLEFDHIIPHSKGGANTYRNIQLLCEPCNRSKSAKIG